MSSWKSLVRASFRQMVGTGFLMAGLLLVANILLIGTWNTQQIRDYVQPKLGMYFYVAQGVDQQVGDQTAVALIEELKEAGLETTFFSKEQAFTRLTAQVPDVLHDLEKYGIENPLPATIYVNFASQEEFEIMKSIVIRYDALIANSNDLSQGVRFSTQEKRIQTAMNLMQGIQGVGIVLILGVLVVIVTFVGRSCVLNVRKFDEQVYLEKLLGAPLRKIIAPFVLYVVSSIVVGFLVFTGVGAVLVQKFQPAVHELFGISMQQFAFPGIGWGELLMRERCVLLALALVVALIVLRRLIARRG